MNWHSNLQLFILLFSCFVAFIMIFAQIMCFVFSEQDFNYDPESKFIDFCYYIIVTISGTGYGDITPKSVKAKLFVSFLILFFYLSLLSLSIISVLPSFTSS